MTRYRVQNLNCALDHGEQELRRKAARELGVRPEDLLELVVERRSVDAREKRDIRIVYAVAATLASPAKSPSGKASLLPPAEPYRFPVPRRSGQDGGPRPVVVGAGPAGLFCALMLAEAGYRPLVLERGDDVDRRALAVDAFWRGGELDPESNIQFGEGGAGTFSDGKLSTGVGDEGGRGRRVLEEFVAAGAPADILASNKPHIGTDYLRRVVRGLRDKIERLGGEVHFRAAVTGLVARDDRVTGVDVAGLGRIDADAVALAIGHSARDSFAMLAASGVPMERKPFAIGLRVEHPQEMLSRAQYGEAWNHPALGAADYKLTHRAADGRGVYSFCMCPGGHVVDASSEPGLSACNGMSDFRRDGRNANSAIVVAVREADFGFEAAGVLSGVEFQRRWERLAWEAAGGRSGRSALPVQTLADFTAGSASTRLGGVSPSIKGAWALADLSACLPPFVAAGIREAFPAFDRRIRGFARPDAVLVGVETRTSSPVRILRGDGLESSLAGLFPCGEGAGYAGGIMSAAMDGIKVAEAIASASSVTSPSFGRSV